MHRSRDMGNFVRSSPRCGGQKVIEMSCLCGLTLREVQRRNQDGVVPLIANICQNIRVDGAPGICGYPLEAHPSPELVGEITRNEMIAQFAHLAPLVNEKFQTVDERLQTLEVVKRDVQQGGLSRSSAALTTYTLVERMKMLESSGNYVASRELEMFLMQRQVNWWPVGARTKFPGPGSGETDTCEPFFSKIMELFATGEVQVIDDPNDTKQSRQNNHKPRTIKVCNVPNPHAYKEKTVADAPPAAVFYDGCDKTGYAAITLEGGVTGGGKKDFQSNEIGRLTLNMERLMRLQPFRNILFGFLTDSRRLLVVRCTRVQPGNPQSGEFHFEFSGPHLGRTAWQILFGLIITPPNVLGYVKVNIPGYTVDGVLGTGAFSVVLRATRRIASATDDVSATTGAIEEPGLPQGWVRRRVAGDGNCFFHAMADQLRRAGVHAPGGPEYTHERLRDIAVNFVKNWPEIRTLMSGEEEIDLARLTGWVEHIAVAALAQALRVNIHIHQPTGRPTFLAPALHTAAGVPTPDAPDVHIFYNGVNHYDSLVPVEPTGSAATPSSESAVTKPAVEEQPRQCDLRKRRLALATVVRKRAKLVYQQKQDVVVKIYNTEWTNMRNSEKRALTMLQNMRNVPKVIEERNVAGRPALLLTPVANKVRPGKGGVRTSSTDYVHLLQVLCRAHAEGLCHRDVKPGNIFKADGLVILGDWGAAAAAGEEVPWTGTDGFYDQPADGRAFHLPDPAHDLVALVRSAYMMNTGLPLDRTYGGSRAWKDAEKAEENLDYDYLLVFFDGL